jgi:hypothetical protein
VPTPESLGILIPTKFIRGWIEKEKACCFHFPWIASTTLRDSVIDTPGSPFMDGFFGPGGEKNLP